MAFYDGQYDFILFEIGGTVGDIESLPFLEAARQFTWERGAGNTLNIHLTYIPYIKTSGELKTKPTQHSVKTLMEYGIKQIFYFVALNINYQKMKELKSRCFVMLKKNLLSKSLMPKIQFTKYLLCLLKAN